MLKKDKGPDIIRTDHVDVLDGIRAVSVLIVAFFHFWQQSWYSFSYSSDLLNTLGIGTISTDWIQRYGFLFVDMMILMTGFCLFLPYARHMIQGERNPGIPDPVNVWTFYKKRLVRILPSYLFCFTVFLILAIPDRNYAVWTDFFKDEYMWKNIWAQLTFTQNLNADTLFYSPFNGALWTVAVEMQFYLFFPLIAFLFKKKPILTFMGMNLISYGFIHFKVLKMADGDISAVINRLPALFGVFAMGMLASVFFVALADKIKERNKLISGVFTGIAIAMICVICKIMKDGPDRGVATQRWQIQIRFAMSILFAVFVVAACLSAKWFRFIFSNKVAVFAAGISYNFYVWHQPIAVKLKEWHFPFWEGENPPNMTGDKDWQIKYTLIIFAASVIAAAAVTYGIEKPFAKLFLKGRKKKNETQN